MLPFTADVLHSLFEQYNETIWPAQIVACGLGLAALFLALKPARGSGRLIAALLAAAWAWVGVVYHFIHFATINFAAPVYGAAFILQALLLAWTGVVRGGIAFRFRADVFGWIGLGLALFAMAGDPLLEWLAGRGWSGTPLFGVAPGPTAMATIGLLLLTEGRTPLRLVVIPVLWSLVDGATAWILTIPQDLVLPVAGIGGLGLVVWKRRRPLQFGSGVQR